MLIILPWIGLIYSPDPTGLGIKFAKKNALLDLLFGIGIRQLSRTIISVSHQCIPRWTDRECLDWTASIHWPITLSEWLVFRIKQRI
jgi:hypothetical protein